MTHNPSPAKNRVLILTGLGVALVIAVFLSPFASSNPDGLDRVAQDQKIDDRAIKDGPAQKLPFYAIFDQYAVRGVPKAIATPLAGLVGTLVTFGLAWGAGKVLVRKSDSPDP
jgi:cobalt/nickel transport protein